VHFKEINVTLMMPFGPNFQITISSLCLRTSLIDKQQLPPFDNNATIINGSGDINQGEGNNISV